jgi:hypothetical protein
LAGRDAPCGRRYRSCASWPEASQFSSSWPDVNDNGESIGGLKADAENLERRVDRIEDKVDGLVRFQAWAMGIATATGALVGFFSQSIKAWFQHP